MFVDSESQALRVKVESKSSKIFFSRVRVESRELSSHVESLVCKLESISSHTNLHVLSTTFFCYEMAPNMP